jgi:type I restriction enzyme S subunit
MTVALWKSESLSDLADMCLGKMLDKNKNKGTYLPYLANTNVLWGEIELSNLREMKFEPKELERYGLEPGDIVMCEGGEPGRCAIWKGQTASMMIQKALHRIRAKKNVSSVFLYYALLNKGIQGEYDAYFTGAAIKHLTGEKLAKIKVLLPPLIIQQKIAAILSAYDDLIENNLKRIKLLEEMAQITYEEWFVRLKFPGHETTPLDSTTGLPVGWKKEKLGNLTSYINRGVSPDYVENDGCYVINQKCIRNHYVNLEEARLTSKAKRIPDDKLINKLDILINSTGTGTLGRVAQIFSTPGFTTVDTHVTIVRASTPIFALYLGRALEHIESFIENLGKGATNQQELSRTDLAELVNVLVPTKDLLIKYDEFSSPIYESISMYQSQNQLLKEARDILLPRLMTGMIDVEQLVLPEPFTNPSASTQEPQAV